MLSLIDAQAAIIAVGGILTGLVATLAIAKWLRHEPTDIRVPDQPVRIKNEHEPMTVAQCMSLHTGQDHRISRLENMVEEIRQTQASQIGNAHRRMDAMLEMVAKLSGVTDGVKSALDNIHEELRSLRAGGRHH